jgi:hypothetical protein
MRHEAPTFCRQLTDIGEVVILTYQLSSTPRKFLVLISVKRLLRVNRRTIVQLEGLDQLKNPFSSLGNEPATSQLVA